MTYDITALQGTFLIKSGKKDLCTEWLASLHVLEAEQVSIRRKGLALFKL